MSRLACLSLWMHFQFELGQRLDVGTSTLIIVIALHTAVSYIWAKSSKNSAQVPSMELTLVLSQPSLCSHLAWNGFPLMTLKHVWIQVLLEFGSSSLATEITSILFLFVFCCSVLELLHIGKWLSLDPEWTIHPSLAENNGLKIKSADLHPCHFTFGCQLDSPPRRLAGPRNSGH